MINIKKLVLALIVADILLIVLSLYNKDNWLISSQSAFFASLLVTISSFIGYKRMVQRRVEIGDIPKEDRDELDIIDDRHDLYQDDKDLKEVIKEERAKLGGVKNSAIVLKESRGASLSLLRLLSYGVLFFSFLYLNRHGLLNIMGYLSGLAVVPLVAFLSIFLKK